MRAQAARVRVDDPLRQRKQPVDLAIVVCKGEERREMPHDLGKRSIRYARLDRHCNATAPLHGKRQQERFFARLANEQQRVARAEITRRQAGRKRLDFCGQRLPA